MSLTKKIAAFDLDDTLTESKQALSVDMAQLLADLSQKIKVVIISGGSIHQFKKQILQTFLSRVPHPDAAFSNMILLPTSGSQRYEYNSETKDWDLTDMEPFAEDLKLKAIKALEYIVASGEYDLPEEHFGERIEERGTQITLSVLGQDAPVDKKMAWDPDESKRKKIQHTLQAMLPEMEVRVGGSTSIDILHKGFNKAVGLLRLLNKLNLQKEDMVFVGDAVFPDGNDYPPLEAGIETIAVKNPGETAELIKKWLDR
jgi:phosphomannomutase